MHDTIITAGLIAYALGIVCLGIASSHMRDARRLLDEARQRAARNLDDSRKMMEAFDLYSYGARDEAIGLLKEICTPPKVK